MKIVLSSCYFFSKTIIIFISLYALSYPIHFLSLQSKFSLNIFNQAWAVENNTKNITGSWVYSDQLKPGMKILTAENHILTVENIWEKQKNTITYNFEVADNHTYFVSEYNLWVHNQGICDPIDNATWDAMTPAQRKARIEKIQAERARIEKEFNERMKVRNFSSDEMANIRKIEAAAYENSFHPPFKFGPRARSTGHFEEQVGGELEYVVKINMARGDIYSLKYTQYTQALQKIASEMKITIRLEAKIGYYNPGLHTKTFNFW